MRQGEQPRGPASEVRRPKLEQKDDVAGPPIITAEMMERARTLGREVSGDQELPDHVTHRGPERESITISTDAEQIGQAQARAREVADRQESPVVTEQPQVIDLRGTDAEIQPPSIMERVKGAWSKLFSREVAAVETENVSEPSEAELAEARQLLVELPERPNSNEVRAALVELLKKLPEIYEKVEGGPIMSSLESFIGDPNYLRTDAIVIQDIMKEEAVRDRFPAKKEVYTQLEKLAEALKVLNDQTPPARRRKSIISSEEVVKGMLADYSLSRFQWEHKKAIAEGRVQETPSYGEVVFSDEERAQMRAQMETDAPDVLEVQQRAFDGRLPNPDAISPVQIEMPAPPVGALEKEVEPESVKTEAEVTESEPAFVMAGVERGPVVTEQFREVPNIVRGQSMEVPAVEATVAPEPRNGDLVVKRHADASLARKGELWEDFMEKIMHQNPELYREEDPITTPEEFRERLRETRHETDGTTIQDQIRTLRQEIAAKREDIAKKQERLENDYPWWNLSFSARTGRKGTQAAIARLEGDIGGAAGMIGEFKNILQMVTPKEREAHKAMYERSQEARLEEIPDENIEDVEAISEEPSVSQAEEIEVTSLPSVESPSVVNISNESIDPRQETIDSIKGELARLKESIAGKRQRLERDYQWWKLGSREARKATLAAIARDEQQLHDKQWLLADILNESQLPTRDELDALPQEWVKEPISHDELIQVESDKRTVRQDMRNNRKDAA